LTFSFLASVFFSSPGATIWTDFWTPHRPKIFFFDTFTEEEVVPLPPPSVWSVPPPFPFRFFFLAVFCPRLGQAVFPSSYNRIPFFPLCCRFLAGLPWSPAVLACEFQLCAESTGARFPPRVYFFFRLCFFPFIPVIPVSRCLLCWAALFQFARPAPG